MLLHTSENMIKSLKRFHTELFCFYIDRFVIFRPIVFCLMTVDSKCVYFLTGFFNISEGDTTKGIITSTTTKTAISANAPESKSATSTTEPEKPSKTGTV